MNEPINVSPAVPLPRTVKNLAKTLWYKFYRFLPWATVTIYGIRLRAVNYRMLERSFVTHEYEPLDFKELERLATPEFTFIDIGANIGLYSLFVSKNLKPRVIYAFEPSSRKCFVMIKNIYLNSPAAVSLRQVACSCDVGIHQMNIARDFDRGSNSLGNFYYGDTKLKNTEKVMCTTLDRELEHHILNPHDIIKIDTDGHEFDVLIGARKTINKGHPILLIEYPTNKVVSLLAEWNYTYTWESGMFNTVFTWNGCT